MGSASPPKLLVAGVVVLIANSAYLAAVASPTLFFYANVALHVGLGAVVAVVALVYGLKARHRWTGGASIGWIVFLCRRRIRHLARLSSARRARNQRVAVRARGARRAVRAGRRRVARSRHRAHHVSNGAAPGDRRRPAALRRRRPPDPRQSHVEAAVGGAVCDRQPVDAAAEHARRRRRAGHAVLPFVGAHQRRRHHSRRTSS